MGRGCLGLLASLIISGSKRVELAEFLFPLCQASQLLPSERPWPDLAREAVRSRESSGPPWECDAGVTSGGSGSCSLLWTFLALPLIPTPGPAHTGFFWMETSQMCPTVGWLLAVGLLGLRSPSVTPSLKSSVSGACESTLIPFLSFLKINLHFEMGGLM